MNSTFTNSFAFKAFLRWFRPSLGIKTLTARILLIITLTPLSPGFTQSVSVSPSRLYFGAEPGQTRSHTVRITNNSQSRQAFLISFADFESPGSSGKTEIMEAGTSPNSCAQWLSASPSLLELEGGETRDVEVILQLPNTPQANRVSWASMFVRLARERTTPADLTPASTGFGIMQTFQFVIHIFQTPPGITFKDAEIISFTVSPASDNEKPVLVLHVKNTGEAIIDVAAYLEYTHLGSGNHFRDKARAFTILPGGNREVRFSIPEDLPPGNYNVLGVVDYGSREAVIAAETELTLP